MLGTQTSPPRSQGKLASVLEEAWQGLQETERRRRAVQEELEQKERALELARSQEQLDEVVLGEMQLQLARCREEEAAAVLQVQQKASEASYERLEAERVQQRSEEVEAQSEELQHLRSTEYARRSEYQDCVQAVKELKDEMQRQGEEQSHAAQRLQSLRLALETRREELRLLLERLQQLQRAGDADLQRQKIKEQMIADAEQQVADLQQALAEAEKAKQENDLAWRDRLTEATTSAEEHAQRAEALRQSSLEHEEEIAKLRRQARAKGERNDYVEMQLEQVNRMTEERSSSLEAKVQAMRAEGGEVLDEARWAQSEMEQRFRSERAEQLQQEKDGRSRLAQLRPRLQSAPAQRLALERRIAEEKKASKERVARLLATFGAAPSWR